MKKLLGLMIALTLSAAGAEPADKPAPTMPSEVTLTTGRVLRNVQVIRWESNRVVLKYTGGVDPIAFSLFKSPSPSEVAALKGLAAEAARKAAAAEAARGPEVTHYKGQAFIRTQGGETRKLSGLTINICTPETLSALDDGGYRPTLKAPIKRIQTDADGNFSFEMLKGERFLIFTQSSRFVGGKVGTELYEWRIMSDEITDPAAILLSHANARDRVREVIWEG